MEKIFYPLTQRRLRTDTHIRELTASVKLSHKSFIQPLFVDEAIAEPRPVNGLADVEADTASTVLKTIERSIKGGATKFLLFPVPAEKKESNFNFSFATAVIRSIKKNFGNDVWIASDLCLCSYTTHGHCGILNDDHSKLVNHKTVDVLSKYATQLAVAGADSIAPSDMTDGRITAIRTALDALGYDTVSIMSYSAKFSSQFYGPFRDACHSAPNTKGLKNRKTYQLSPLNSNDAIVSSLRDEKEGADILMVKPAGLYTDIIARLKQQTLKPIAAYHVSGEFAAIEALAEKGLVNREAANLEVWTALTRAGSDIIISYAAKNAKEWIDKMEY
ncbi:MAG TPA: porphobilinogen synthase [Chitinophagaceae bacterium]|nr:porphobilinogen synthase [Chitinophagaceae bacterium]